jgi:hypothetical protein
MSYTYDNQQTAISQNCPATSDDGYDDANGTSKCHQHRWHVRKWRANDERHEARLIDGEIDTDAHDDNAEHLSITTTVLCNNIGPIESFIANN